jgi:uncharacterized protein YbjT (DUF2867 family)
MMNENKRRKAMSNNGKIILVTGATGQQGGASARHLQARGWKVRALSRDPHKPAARALADAGAEVVQGDLNDRASLDRALKGAYGVHSVQSYMPHDPTGEIYQGKTLVDAAKAAGVAHFIYSSAGGADRHTGIAEQENKWEIEQYLQASGLSATILRPTFFMEIFSIPFFRQMILGGTWSFALRPETKVQMIATDDIGAFVALALEHQRDFVGKAIEIAGDELTMPQTVEVFSRVIGRPVRFIEQLLEQVRSFDPNLAKLAEWLNDEGFRADIPALRAVYPDLMTLETCLRKSGWEQVT